MSSCWIHPTADVADTIIGQGSRVWQFVVILSGARIGRNVNICSHVFIESDVLIGDDVTIKSGVQLWNGMVVEDGVFIGPNATFCNDKHPRSKNRAFVQESILLRKGCSIGAGAVILPGVSVGLGAMVGAGAVVSADVGDYDTVIGNPARRR